MFSLTQLFIFINFFDNLHLSSITLHCNQKDQENLDHLLGYTFEKDDESKLAIDCKISFYLNLGYK